MTSIRPIYNLGISGNDILFADEQELRDSKLPKIHDIPIELIDDFLKKTGIFQCLYPLITVMLYTGIRVGELGGMRWADVDFEKNQIEISHTLVFEEKPDQKGSVFSLNPPKTKPVNERYP